MSGSMAAKLGLPQNGTDTQNSAKVFGQLDHFWGHTFQEDGSSGVRKGLLPAALA